MAKGGGGWMPPPTGFPNFSREWKELLLQTKFLAVGSSLEHLSMKKFLDRSYRLGSNETKGGCWGGGNHHDGLFTYFSNHEDDIQS